MASPEADEAAGEVKQAKKGDVLLTKGEKKEASGKLLDAMEVPSWLSRSEYERLGDDPMQIYEATRTAQQKGKRFSWRRPAALLEKHWRKAPQLYRLRREKGAWFQPRWTFLYAALGCLAFAGVLVLFSVLLLQSVDNGKLRYQERCSADVWERQREERWKLVEAVCQDALQDLHRGDEVAEFFFDLAKYSCWGAVTTAVIAFL
eukprot:Sspe_Gene.84544::Locus_55492_Transcript_1_1_Confidence_1.000_Length_743::g.84544::m.84544